MPEHPKCPLCGTEMVRDWVARGGHLVAYNAHRPAADIYRCPCGPLAVVEGDRVEWYYPQAWLLELARKPAVTDALVDEAIGAYRAAHPKVSEGRS